MSTTIDMKNVTQGQVVCFAIGLVLGVGVGWQVVGGGQSMKME